MPKPREKNAQAKGEKCQVQLIAREMNGGLENRMKAGTQAAALYQWKKWSRGNGHPRLNLSIFCTLQPEQRSHGQDPQGERLSETAVAEELRAE